MCTTLALVMALNLAPAQAAPLRLTHSRATYGIMGAARPDKKILPGDVFCVTFDIENLKVDEGGRVLYKMAMKMTNSQGKVQFNRDPQDLEIINSLGGSSMPAFAGVEIPTDCPAGQYKLEVTVTDRAAKATETLTEKFEVLPHAFGLVQVHTTHNWANNPPAPPIGVAGESYVVNFAAVGFERAGPKKEPSLTVEMQIVDEDGKPTLAKPFPGELDKDLPENIEIVPMQFLLALNRPGKFTISLKAIDQASKTKKTIEVSLPLTVLDSK